jgi:hypothetical protein
MPTADTRLSNAKVHYQGALLVAVHVDAAGAGGVEPTGAAASALPSDRRDSARRPDPDC